MVSTSSCKNFRFFGHPSEKLCPVYGRFLKLCFKNDRDETNVSFLLRFLFFCFCFFYVTEGEKQGSGRWLGLFFFCFFFVTEGGNQGNGRWLGLFFSVFVWRNRRRRIRKQRWLGLWRDQMEDGGNALGFGWWKKEGWWEKTQCDQQQMTRKHTNSTMHIIERKCEAQKGAGIRSNLNFYVFLWTVGEKNTR